MTNIDFSNILIFEFDGRQEFLTYCSVYKDAIGEKQVIWSKEKDYADLFAKGASLNEEKQYKKAISQLKNALDFNPIGIAARFELAESYIGLEDYTTALQKLLELKDILMSDSAIARFYRRIGFVFFKENKNELSLYCFKQSRKYEKTDDSNLMVRYLAKITGIHTKDDYEAKLKENNIPIIQKIGKQDSDGVLKNKKDTYDVPVVEKTEEFKKDSSTQTQSDNKNKKTETRIMFCRKCGSKLNIGAVFCHKCGTKIQ